MDIGSRIMRGCEASRMRLVARPQYEAHGARGLVIAQCDKHDFRMSSYCRLTTGCLFFRRQAYHWALIGKHILKIGAPILDWSTQIRTRSPRARCTRHAC